MSGTDEPGSWDHGQPDRRGRPYVYVLPSLGEDLTKVGFTHDPLQRFRAFHPRFFALFDLDRGLLVETRRLAEARRLERLLIERWPEHRATAPLLVSSAAGGHTEWFRGIGDEVGPFIARIAERYGYPLHAPLREWLRLRFAEHADQLFEWSSRLLAMIEWQAQTLPPQAREPRYAQALIDTLDACGTVGMDLVVLVPPEVLAWYRRC